MNLSSIILLLVTINVLFTFASFAINNDDSLDVISDFTAFISADITIFESFTKSVSTSDNWASGFQSAIASAFQTALNTIWIGFKIVGLIIGNLFIVPVNIWLEISIPILRIAGYVGYLIFLWINITAITNLFSYLKGASK